ncbi:LPS assembly lipoprotein LptE [Falsiroseomonas ponticola]|uniref:LPS assembly lipoprotein LptE n=1 Tax=Falsiroseomonas ponticola TaxID=2786951 RepID=UPI0019331E5A|nr:LPS assembly lipoprotein LptE [Roseomonas ponticola]
MSERPALFARRAALLGACGLLAGCGFRPLYGSNGAAAVAAGEPSVRDQLLATRVAPINERFGQLIRRGLLQRLGNGITGARQPLYELRVGPGVAAEGVGVQVDGAATRVRYIATANWVLVRLGPPPEGIMSGQERAIEAYNIPANQFFAADSSREATEQRLAATLAEQIVQRVAAEFRRRAEGHAAEPVEAPLILPATPGDAVPQGLSDPASPGLLGLPPGSR